MAKDPRYFNPDQFSNPLNVECHYRTTGQEIIAQIAKHSGSVDAFVAGVGTGGTLIGTGKALREKYGKTHIVAVEPSESAVMSGGKPGMHSIQGIGDGFIPAIAGDGKGGLNPLIDEVICISTEDAKNAAKYLGSKGICVGVSSGANYLAAKKLAERFDNVVTVFSDGFSKYVSQGLARSGSGPCPFTAECNCPAKNDCKKGGKTGNCKCG
jgi:cysteine synthase A